MAIDLDLDRSPTELSRLLVLFVLLPVLIVDLVFDMPEWFFLGAGALVFAIAAGLHARVAEYRAMAGWLVFGASLIVVAAVDVAADPLYLAAFVTLLFAGLLLLASQRLGGD